MRHFDVRLTERRLNRTTLERQLLSARMRAPLDEALGGIMAVQAQEPETNIIEGCVEDYDPAVNYFPEQISIEYVENMTVEDKIKSLLEKRPQL